MISYYGSGWKDVVSQCLEFDQDLVSTCRSAPQGGRSGVVSLRVRIVVVVDRLYIYKTITSRLTALACDST